MIPLGAWGYNPDEPPIYCLPRAAFCVCSFIVRCRIIPKRSLAIEMVATPQVISVPLRGGFWSSCFERVEEGCLGTDQVWDFYN